MIPCNDCITLPICKQTYLNSYGLKTKSIDPSELSVYQLENYAYKLRKKCSILEDYTGRYYDFYNRNYIEAVKNELRELYTFMKGIKQ